MTYFEVVHHLSLLDIDREDVVTAEYDTEYCDFYGELLTTCH